MNYYEHHIGDYDKNTAHLTACEDGIYSRMIRRYYLKEKALDPDVSEIKRLVRARTKEEKSAVDSMLKEFFHLEEDGWHHDHCDEVLAAYLAGEPEREVKKANEDNRLKRHREERAALFRRLTDAGQHAPWNIGMAELREMVKRISEPPETDAPPLPATAPATPATATQYPIPNTQTPLLSSVPNGTGADAPPTAEEKLATMKKELWAEGKALFASKEISAEKAGKILGQLLGEYSAEIVLNAVRAGVKAETPDPTRYLKACCQKAAGERANVQKNSRHNGFDKTDYSEGVTEDGRIA